MRLSDAQIRVLGCLIEKQRTTPDSYPLSLNSLRLACNQSTNRNPVVDYDESVIREALHGLERRGLTRLASGAGSRAAKYRHLLDEALPLSAGERAVMSTLMLRGDQTPGELKQRSERMHAFDDLDSVQRVLDDLIGRDLAARLPRRPGHKEERYAHLLGADQDEKDLLGPGAGDGRSAQRPAVSAVSSVATGGLEDRVSRLERELEELRRQLFAQQSGATVEAAEDAP